MIEKESDRKDQTDLLGEPLTFLEDRCYKLIHLNAEKPISKSDLFRQLYGKEPISNNSKDLERAWVLVSRIRNKLGFNSIVTLWGKGYVSKRAYIEANAGNRNQLMY